ncbi:MAG: ribose-phosphate diphosphokinase, partial [Gammaproteobacteria bacterium]|nr:ribose-phosphate diphosphokinase [Gammaproteobacteria bacterium]
MLILTFPDYLKQSQQLARTLGVPCKVVDVHHFPDGENKVCLPAELPEHVVLCRSLNNPNEKLIELLLSAETARQMGVNKLTLVAPYLCYMRQDSAFTHGEAISQRIICRWLGDMFDTIVTVDPHLHRVEQLSELFPNTQTVTLSATALMGELIRARFNASPLLLGPDSESQQWVKQVADSAALDYTICHKTRHGDHDVDVHLGDCDLA